MRTMPPPLLPQMRHGCAPTHMSSSHLGSAQWTLLRCLPNQGCHMGSLPLQCLLGLPAFPFLLPQAPDDCGSRGCLTIQAFLVNTNPTPQRPARWYPTDPKIMEHMHKVACEEGRGSPYLRTMLEDWSTDLCCPGDYKHLMCTLLFPGDFLLWKVAYDDECDQEAKRNNLAGVQLNYDCLAGEGVYSTTMAQSHGTSQYLLRLCTMHAWRRTPCSGAAKEQLHKLVQGPLEPFTDFVARVQEAVQLKATHQGAADTLLKEFIKEGYSSECQRAIELTK